MQTRQQHFIKDTERIEQWWKYATERGFSFHFPPSSVAVQMIIMNVQGDKYFWYPIKGTLLQPAGKGSGGWKTLEGSLNFETVIDTLSKLSTGSELISNTGML